MLTPAKTTTVSPSYTLPTDAPNLPMRLNGMNLRELWRRLWRQKWWFLLTLFSVLALTAYITFTIQPTYRAVATLQIEKEGVKVVNFGTVNSASPDLGERDPFFRTQYEQLKSRKLAENVIKELSLNERLFSQPTQRTLMAHLSKGISDLWTLLPFNNAVPEKAPDNVEQFLRKLYIEPVEQTHLVKVFYESPDPALSAQIVNTLVAEFIKQHISTQSDTDTYAKDFLEGEMEKARQRLTMQEAKLVEYAKQNGILEVNNSQSTQEKKLGELYTALGEAQRNRIQAESLMIQGKRTGNVRDVLNDPLVNSLKQNLITLEAEYQEKSKVFKPAYPDMMQLQQQIASIRGQLNGHVGDVKQSLNTNFNTAKKLENDLQGQVDAYKDELVNLRDKSIEYNALKREVETSRNLYDGLLQRMKEVNVAANVTTSNIKIIDNAVLPNKIFRPNKLLNMLLGGLVGTLLGVGLALLRDSLSQHIHTVGELQALSGLPILGMIPHAPRQSERQLATATVTNLGSAVAESYRVAAANLRFVLPQGAPRVLLVTSVNPAEGKSTSAVNLALSQAQMGLKVLLLDADLRRPSIHTKLGLSNQKGLSNYLVNQLDITAVTQSVKQVRGLYVVTAGNVQSDPVRMLSSSAMVRLLGLAIQHFDSVIIDSPPITGFADSLYLSSLAQATVLVADEDKMHRKRLLSAIEQLRRIKHNIVGFIMVKSEEEALDDRYYSHYQRPSKGMVSNPTPTVKTARKRKGLNLAPI